MKEHDEIYRYVFRQLSGNVDTYDLTQEIFISMLRSIKTYKKEQASFRTWLDALAGSLLGLCSFTDFRYPLFCCG